MNMDMDLDSALRRLAELSVVRTFGTDRGLD